MERNEVFARMQDICRDVFDDAGLVLTEATVAADVEGWDSLAHLSLVNELEEQFDIAFTLEEVIGSGNPGELLTALMKHIKEKREKP